MTLQQLRYFLATAETLHYTRAAKKMFVSQPSLSYALAALEKELGASLFAREGRRVSLTPHGERFLPHARRCLAALEDGLAALREMERPAGTVELGYIYSVGFRLLPVMISRFGADERNRDISFHFFHGVNAQICEKLRGGELDLALAPETDNADIAGTPVFAQELFLAVPETHPFAGRAGVALRELKDEKFVTITRNSSLRAWLDSRFAAAGFSPRIVCETGECDAMAAFVSSGYGVAVMPRVPSLEAYRVKTVPLADPGFRRTIYLRWAAGRPLPPAAEAFRAFALAHGMWEADPEP